MLSECLVIPFSPVLCKYINMDTCGWLNRELDLRWKGLVFDSHYLSCVEVANKFLNPCCRPASSN